MPDHPALAILIDLPTARQLFPGVPSSAFHEAGQPGHGRGLWLTFAAAFHAAVNHWQPLAAAAKSSRALVRNKTTWKTRRAAAAEAALARLQAAIGAELDALAVKSGGDCEGS